MIHNFISKKKTYKVETTTFMVKKWLKTYSKKCKLLRVDKTTRYQHNNLKQGGGKNGKEKTH